MSNSWFTVDNFIEIVKKKQSSSIGSKNKKGGISFVHYRLPGKFLKGSSIIQSNVESIHRRDMEVSFLGQSIWEIVPWPSVPSLGVNNQNNTQYIREPEPEMLHGDMFMAVNVMF